MRWVRLLYHQMRNKKMMSKEMPRTAPTMNGLSAIKCSLLVPDLKILINVKTLQRESVGQS